MRRTCERPGCAEPASVAFGMVPEDLLVWLQACDPATLGDDRPGLLCRRHADTMVVPVGWTLDDHREPVPRLFKVPEPAPPARRSGDHTGRMRRPKLEQVPLFDLAAERSIAAAIIDAVAHPTPPAAPPAPDAEDGAVTGVEDGAVTGVVEPAPAAEPAAEPAWTPRFDHSDDLGGLLTPRGKLLRRAFGAEPPR